MRYSDKIDCFKCDATCVGQTKRQLKTSVNEHKGILIKNSDCTSII